VVEIIPVEGWYDYSNKYTKGKTIYQAPAELSEQEAAKISEYALQLYKLFDCKAYARVDFRCDGDKFYFLELNTLPGMTPLSLTPMAAEAAGIGFANLLKKIIDCSL